MTVRGEFAAKRQTHTGAAMFRLRRNLPRKLCFLEYPGSRPAGREILCFHKDQEGRRSSPVGCCVVGNPIKGFPDAARHAAFVQLAIGKPVFRQAEAPDFYPEPARVDKVDTLLDGDAGSRRLVILALLPLSPPVPPLLLKNSGNTCVSTIFRL